MTTKRVYLSGPINGQTPLEAGSWRRRAIELLNLNLLGALDPMRGKTHLDADKALTPQSCINGGWVCRDQVIVERDLRDIRDCDGILVYVGVNPEKPIVPMTGTVCEVFAAKYLFDVPIPCVAFKDPGDHVHPQFYSPWFGKFLTPEYGVLNHLGEAIDFLLEVM